MSFAISGLHHPLSLAFALALLGVHLLVVARAITRPGRTPASRVAWVAVIMSIPTLGVIAYLLLGETSIGRERVARLRQAERLLTLPYPIGTEPALIPQLLQLSELCSAINGLQMVGGNRIELLSHPEATPQQPMLDSNAAIDALIVDIAAAREHVHISFYIWLDDDHGGRVADAVAAAAQRGVKCRVMVDALGSRAFIRGQRLGQLRNAGVDLLATLDDVPRLGHLAVGRLDLRNHRKLVVIDNAIAYCGSQNCADPQFRVLPNFAPWIDLLLRCEGPVVRQAQWLFLSAWIAETGEQQLEAMPAAQPMPAYFEPGVLAQMYGTGPTTHGNAMSDSFVGAIYAARHELLITTPYFVPDEALLRALCAAPRRGVKTTIVFPARNNSWLVACACRSTYLALLESGVSIHEYPLGLLHTKSLTADGQFALIGSANMDRRSMQLNFENNLLVADAAVTAAIRQRQLGYLSVSLAVSLEAVKAWPLYTRLLQNAVGMMAPVGSMPFRVELDNLKDTDVPIHPPAASPVATD